MSSVGVQGAQGAGVPRLPLAAARLSQAHGSTGADLGKVAVVIGVFMLMLRLLRHWGLHLVHEDESVAGARTTARQFAGPPHLVAQGLGGLAMTSLPAQFMGIRNAESIPVPVVRDDAAPW